VSPKVCKSKVEWMKWLSVEICRADRGGSGGITRRSVSPASPKVWMQK
jgi:hypothetical protein